MSFKKKILVLGATGLIGHQAFNYLDASGQYVMYNFSFRKKLNDNSILVDARNEIELIAAIRNIKPNYVVNCIGVLVGSADRVPENAIFLNAYLPHLLNKLSDCVNFKLIHISTDCVFSGNKKTPYFEYDAKDGRGVYAQTKAIGEVINDRHLTLRTSVVGPELKTNGEELFHWFMGQNGSVNGFTASRWSGVSSIELAKAIESGIRNDITGIHHVTNNNALSKYDLLMLFKKYTGKDISIVPVEGVVSDKSFVDTRKLIDISIPSYEVMISDMIAAVRDNPGAYQHYTLN